MIFLQILKSPNMGLAVEATSGITSGVLVAGSFFLGQGFAGSQKREFPKKLCLCLGNGKAGGSFGAGG